MDKIIRFLVSAQMFCEQDNCGLCKSAIDAALKECGTQPTSTNTASKQCASCLGEKCINYPNSCSNCRHGTECYAQLA